MNLIYWQDAFSTLVFGSYVKVYFPSFSVTMFALLPSEIHARLSLSSAAMLVNLTYSFPTLWFSPLVNNVVNKNSSPLVRSIVKVYIPSFSVNFVSSE